MADETIKDWTGKKLNGNAIDGWVPAFKGISQTEIKNMKEYAESLKGGLISLRGLMTTQDAEDIRAGSEYLLGMLAALFDGVIKRPGEGKGKYD